MLYTNASLLKGTERNIQCWTNQSPASIQASTYLCKSEISPEKQIGRTKNEGLCCLFLGFVLFLDGEFFLFDACAFFEFVFPFRELSYK